MGNLSVGVSLSVNVFFFGFVFLSVPVINPVTPLDPATSATLSAGEAAVEIE